MDDNEHKTPRHRLMRARFQRDNKNEPAPDSRSPTEALQHTHQQSGTQQPQPKATTSSTIGQLGELQRPVRPEPPTSVYASTSELVNHCREGGLEINASDLKRHFQILDDVEILRLRAQYKPSLHLQIATVATSLAERNIHVQAFHDTLLIARLDGDKFVPVYKDRDADTILALYFDVHGEPVMAADRFNDLFRNLWQNGLNNQSDSVARGAERRQDALPRSPRRRGPRR